MEEEEVEEEGDMEEYLQKGNDKLAKVPVYVNNLDIPALWYYTCSLE